jgi:hypothetical protein
VNNKNVDIRYMDVSDSSLQKRRLQNLGGPCFVGPKLYIGYYRIIITIFSKIIYGNEILFFDIEVSL